MKKISKIDFYDSGKTVLKTINVDGWKKLSADENSNSIQFSHIKIKFEDGKVYWIYGLELSEDERKKISKDLELKNKIIQKNYQTRTEIKIKLFIPYFFSKDQVAKVTLKIDPNAKQINNLKLAVCYEKQFYVVLSYFNNIDDFGKIENEDWCTKLGRKLIDSPSLIFKSLWPKFESIFENEYYLTFSITNDIQKKNKFNNAVFNLDYELKEDAEVNIIPGYSPMAEAKIPDYYILEIRNAKTNKKDDVAKIIFNLHEKISAVKSSFPLSSLPALTTEVDGWNFFYEIKKEYKEGKFNRFFIEKELPKLICPACFPGQITSANLFDKENQNLQWNIECKPFKFNEQNYPILCSAKLFEFYLEFKVLNSIKEYDVRFGSLDLITNSVYPPPSSSQEHSIFHFIVEKKINLESYSIVEIIKCSINFPIKTFIPGNIDDLQKIEAKPNRDSSFKTENNIILIPDKRNTITGDAPLNYVLRIEEFLKTNRSHSLLAKIIAVNNNNVKIPTHKWIVVNTENHFVAGVEIKNNTELKNGFEIAKWSDFGTDRYKWMFQGFGNVEIELTLPPQSIGEEFERREDIGEGDKLKFAFSPSTKITLSDKLLNRNWGPAYWSLNQWLGEMGQKDPGSDVVNLTMELLYGLEVNINEKEYEGENRLKISKLFSLIGNVPNIPQVLSSSSKGEFKNWYEELVKYKKTVMSYLEVLQLRRPGQANSVSITSGLRFLLRKDVLKKPQSEDNGPPDLLKGGALWGLPSSSSNVYKMLVDSPISKKGELENVYLSSLGGWGKFVSDYDKVKIISNTMKGRTSNYSLELLGRVGVFGNLAKYVAVFERTTFPSEQFRETQNKHINRPIVRKVKEYIEILEDEKEINQQFIKSCKFNKGVKIAVDSIWGEDFISEDGAELFKGWKIPLWQKDISDETYPMPEMFLDCQSLSESETGIYSNQISNPENVYFYFISEPTGFPVEKWPAISGIDFCNLPNPKNNEVPELNKDSLNSMLPDAPSVASGFGNMTFNLLSTNVFTALQQSGEGFVAANIENVTLSCSEEIVNSLPEELTEINGFQESFNKIWASSKREGEELKKIKTYFKDKCAEITEGFKTGLIDSIASVTNRTKDLKTKLETIQADAGSRIESGRNKIHKFVDEISRSLELLIQKNNPLYSISKNVTDKILKLKSEAEKIIIDSGSNIQRKKLEINNKIQETIGLINDLEDINNIQINIGQYNFEFDMGISETIKSQIDEIVGFLNKCKFEGDSLDSNILNPIENWETKLKELKVYIVFDFVSKINNALVKDDSCFQKKANKAWEEFCNNNKELNLPDLNGSLIPIKNNINDLIDEVIGNIFEEFPDKIKGEGDEAVAYFQACKNLVLSYYQKSGLAGNIQNGRNAVRILRAWGSAPDVPGMKFNRRKLAYYFKEGQKEIETSPVVISLKDKVKDVFHKLDSLVPFDLKNPTKVLKDRWEFIKDGFVNEGEVYLKDFIRSLGGASLDKLLPKIPVPHNLNKYLEIKNGFHKATGMAWVDLRLNYPIPQSSILYEVNPVKILLKNIRLRAYTKLEASKSGVQNEIGSGNLNADWELELGGTKIITFMDVDVSFNNRGEFDFRLSPDKIILHGVLDVIKSIFPKNYKGNGLSIGLFEENSIPVGIQALLSLSMPDITIGSLSASGLVLKAPFSIAYKNGEFGMGFGFSIGSKNTPFSITLFGVSGACWLENNFFMAGNRTLSRTSMGVAVGMNFGLNIMDIVYGRAYVFFGINIESVSDNGLNKNDYSYSVFILIAGELSVLGLLTAQLKILLEVVYNNGLLIGRGTVSIKIEMLFFDIKIKKSISYEFGDEGSSQNKHEYYKTLNTFDSLESKNNVVEDKGVSQAGGEGEGTTNFKLWSSIEKVGDNKYGVTLILGFEQDDQSILTADGIDKLISEMKKWKDVKNIKAYPVGNINNPITLNVSQEEDNNWYNGFFDKLKEKFNTASINNEKWLQYLEYYSTLPDPISQYLKLNLICTIRDSDKNIDENVKYYIVPDIEGFSLKNNGVYKNGNNTWKIIPGKPRPQIGNWVEPKCFHNNYLVKIEDKVGRIFNFSLWVPNWLKLNPNIELDDSKKNAIKDVLISSALKMFKLEEYVFDLSEKITVHLDKSPDFLNELGKTFEEGFNENTIKKELDSIYYKIIDEENVSQNDYAGIILAFNTKVWDSVFLPQLFIRGYLSDEEGGNIIKNNKPEIIQYLQNMPNGFENYLHKSAGNNLLNQNEENLSDANQLIGYLKNKLEEYLNGSGNDGPNILQDFKEYIERKLVVILKNLFLEKETKEAPPITPVLLKEISEGLHISLGSISDNRNKNQREILSGLGILLSEGGSNFYCLNKAEIKLKGNDTENVIVPLRIAKNFGMANSVISYNNETLIGDTNSETDGSNFDPLFKFKKLNGENLPKLKFGNSYSIVIFKISYSGTVPDIVSTLSRSNENLIDLSQSNEEYVTGTAIKSNFLKKTKYLRDVPVGTPLLNHTDNTDSERPLFDPIPKGVFPLASELETPTLLHYLYPGDEEYFFYENSLSEGLFNFFEREVKIVFSKFSVPLSNQDLWINIYSNDSGVNAIPSISAKLCVNKKDNMELDFKLCKENGNNVVLYKFQDGGSPIKIWSDNDPNFKIDNGFISLKLNKNVNGENREISYSTPFVREDSSSTFLLSKSDYGKNKLPIMLLGEDEKAFTLKMPKTDPQTFHHWHGSVDGQNNESKEDPAVDKLFCEIVFLENRHRDKIFELDGNKNIVFKLKGEKDNDVLVTNNGNQHIISVVPGTQHLVRIYSGVNFKYFKQQDNDQKIYSYLRVGREQHTVSGISYVLFSPFQFIVEAVYKLDELPNDLFDNVSITDAEDKIQGFVNGGFASKRILKYYHKVDSNLQQWRWNGLPLPIDKNLEEYDKMVASWFEQSGDGCYNQTSQKISAKNWSSNKKVALFEKDISLDTRAHYYRMHFVFHNRYNGFIKAEPQILKNGNELWKKIRVPNRMESNLRTPSIRLIIPLTKNYIKSDGSHIYQALVILNEGWFEDCGYEEKLKCEIESVAKGKNDEENGEKIPQVGWDPILTKEKWEGDAPSINIIGPFGHSFDADTQENSFSFCSFRLSIEIDNSDKISSQDHLFAKLKFWRESPKETNGPLKSVPTLSQWVEFLPPADDLNSASKESHGNFVYGYLVTKIVTDISSKMETEEFVSLDFKPPNKRDRKYRRRILEFLIPDIGLNGFNLKTTNNIKLDKAGSVWELIFGNSQSPTPPALLTRVSNPYSTTELKK